MGYHKTQMHHCHDDAVVALWEPFLHDDNLPSTFVQMQARTGGVKEIASD